jgi:ribonuclease HI
MEKMSKGAIEAGKSKKGGFTRAQLAIWGVAWPPRKGWRRRLMTGHNPNGADQPIADPPKPRTVIIQPPKETPVEIFAALPQDKPENLADSTPQSLIEAWFDGCCEPKNPGGHAAWGALVKVNGREVYAAGGYCGVGRGMSNNVAEYSGFVAALTEALKYQGRIVVRGDSRLVICHLSLEAARALNYKSTWKVNGGAYMPFYQQAKPLYDRNKHRVKLVWVPREKNDVCDYLSKQVLKDRGVVFHIQPE